MVYASMYSSVSLNKVKVITDLLHSDQSLWGDLRKTHQLFAGTIYRNAIFRMYSYPCIRISQTARIDSVRDTLRIYYV